MMALVLASCYVLAFSQQEGAFSHSFTVREPVGHSWYGEMVQYRVPLPTAVAVSPDLSDEAGSAVPVQIEPAGDGLYNVMFIVEDLPPDATRRYHLKAGDTSAHTDIAVQVVDRQFVEIDSGRVAARVPSARWDRFDSPIALDEAPAPLLAVRGVSGAWIGKGCMKGGMRVSAMQVRQVSHGPVQAAWRTEYEFEGGGRYAAEIRVVRGQDAVFVTEYYDMPDVAKQNAWFAFSLTPGLEPDRIAAELRPWRERADQVSNELGMDYCIDYGEKRRELSVLGYVNWWPESAMRATFYHAGAPDADALTLMPVRIGRWRNPMGMHVMAGADHSLTLELPVFIDADFGGVDLKSPYYTGKLETGWPLSAGRREWAMYLCRVGEALPADGGSKVLEAVRKYSSLPLDKVKDWVLDWPGEEPAHPLLFVEPGSREALRARIDAYPKWKERLDSGSNPALKSYLLDDPEAGRELIWKGDALDDTPYAWQNMGSLQSLRQYIRQFMCAGYLGERWGTTAPNNARPMREMIKYDWAMSVPGVEADVRFEMRRLMAFLAHIVYDEDWNPTKAGFHRGNVNMPPRHEHHLAVAGCLFPGHPLAAVWRQRGIEEQEWMMAHMVSPGGAWRECPSYQIDAAHLPMFHAAIPLRYGGFCDRFSDARLMSSYNYLMNLCTPPDARFGVRVAPAFGNGTWLPVPFFGWMANLTRTSAPLFSSHMQWMWLEHGRPDWYEFSELLIDPALPAEQPKLESQAFPGFGAVLRSGFPSADEQWIAFHIGENVEHYNCGDQGSFMYYAKGAPLVLHFGSIYYPQFRGAWYFNRISIGHQEVQDGLFGGTELFSGAGDAAFDEYYGRLTDFARLGAVDYATGQHVSSRQGLAPDDARTPMPHNQDFPLREIPEHTWTRHMYLVKSFDSEGREDPLGPGYLILRDDIVSENILPTEWNAWMWVDRIETSGRLAHCFSPYGVRLDVFMAGDAQPAWSTREDTTTFGPGGGIGEHWQQQNNGQPWRERLMNLRNSQDPGQSFLAVLYPKREGETEPVFQNLEDAPGVVIRHTRGEDTLVCSDNAVAWSRDGMAFEGTAGLFRQEGEAWSVTLLAAGRIEAHGYVLQSDGPASLAWRGGRISLATHPEHPSADVILPEEGRLP